MQQFPLVREAMTPFPHFVDVKSDLDEARRMVELHDIDHIPVKDGGQLVGVVTARDLRVAALVAKGGGREPSLEELCDKELLIVGLHAPIDEVVSEMCRKSAGCALVVKEGKLAGIITMGDVCRMYTELVRKLGPPPDELA